MNFSSARLPMVATARSYEAMDEYKYMANTVRGADLLFGVLVVVREGENEGQGAVREGDGAAAPGMHAHAQHEFPCRQPPRHMGFQR